MFCAGKKSSVCKELVELVEGKESLGRIKPSQKDNILKNSYINKIRGRELDLSSSEQGPMAGCCKEKGIKQQGSTKRGEILE